MIYESWHDLGPCVSTYCSETKVPWVISHSVYLVVCTSINIKQQCQRSHLSHIPETGPSEPVRLYTPSGEFSRYFHTDRFRSNSWYFHWSLRNLMSFFISTPLNPSTILGSSLFTKMCSRLPITKPSMQLLGHLWLGWDWCYSIVFFFTTEGLSRDVKPIPFSQTFLYKISLP